MERVRVDVAELRASAARLRSLSPALAPVGPLTPRGLGPYGFPVLARAIERFVGAVDEDLRSGADLLARQAEGLGDTARDFETLEDAAQHSYDAMTGRL